MFGQVDAWESVTNNDWLMHDTSGASVMGSSAVKLQNHKNHTFTRVTHETDRQSTYKGVGELGLAEIVVNNGDLCWKV